MLQLKEADGELAVFQCKCHITTMHILAAHNRSEFLATPQLIRFDHVAGSEGYEPTLLIKASTLLLKYITLGVQMQLVFTMLDNRLLYALKVHDDEPIGCTLWSIVERDNEIAAITALERAEACQVFLFNELALNVSCATLRVSVKPELAVMVAGAATGSVDHEAFKDNVAIVLDGLYADSPSCAGLIVAEVSNITNWKPVHYHYITSHAASSFIDLFNNDEGGQQEQLGIWLTDNLNPRGVHCNPQIPKGNGYRELTDILLSYQFGSILIESKVLAIFARSTLPSRAKLARTVTSHISKAVKQLRGGIRRLQDGTPVSDSKDRLLDVERKQPVHGIVLIPDLDLIEDSKVYDLQFIQEFMEATGGFLHFLDIAELLRIVQAAEIIAARGTETTLMMAFDYYLIERAKMTLKSGSLCIEVLLRIEDE